MYVDMLDCRNLQVYFLHLLTSKICELSNITWQYISENSDYSKYYILEIHIH